MKRAIYSAKGWVLGRCFMCGRLHYVEPHGITAFCKCANMETEHKSIPYDERDKSGCWLVKAEVAR